MRIEPSAEAYKAVLEAGLLDPLVKRLSNGCADWFREVLGAAHLSQEEAYTRHSGVKGKDPLSEALKQALSIKTRESREGNYLSRLADTGLVTKILLNEKDAKKIQEPPHPASWHSIPYGHNAVFACAASQLYDLDHQVACSLWVEDANFRLRRGGSGALVERLDLSEKGIWKTIHPESGLMRQEHFDAPDLSNSNGFCNSQTEKSALEEALRNYFRNQPNIPK
ncbi:MAG: hypothetical protein AABX70_03760 [Nanoarchaeota archaeon]